MILFLSCSITIGKNDIDQLPFSHPPHWSQEAIWYQIFVERFRNGDPHNDPDLRTMQGALTDSIPKDWTVTPWTHNWYEQETWAEKSGLDFYRTIQMRRYGGDLQGVIDKIPYLKELGITAIYFNPLNDAPSLHKYDARSYHHIDVNFGPDPIGDLEIIAREDPNDSRTWQWTSADKLFLALLDSLHRNDIRVVLDFSWNHTGREFWAFKDILKNGSTSAFKEWYEGEIKRDSEGNEYFEYEGWYNIKSLPEWKKINSTGKITGQPYEGNLYDGVKQHIFEVCKKWMDPDGNGNVAKGIDGIRLDVAEHVPVGFWREFRRYVRGVNPEFYLVGENWWQNWPHKLMDTRPWLKGDIFDGVMHYQWYKVARGYFGETEDKVFSGQFSHKMDSVFSVHPDYTRKAMMNLASSHDSPRLLSSFYNRNIYKYYCKPQENPNYLTGRPDEETYDRVKLFLLHQFTFIGSPHIWNGDEMGMWGADDPDNRKPLWWKDYKFQPETESYLSEHRYKQTIEFNTEFFEYYKSLVELRISQSALVHGKVEYVDTNSELVVYKRVLNEENIIIIFNMTAQNQKINLNEIKNTEILFSYNNNKKEELNSNLIPPLSALVVKSNLSSKTR